MLFFAHPWMFALAPLPWILRAALPARHPARVAVRVPFGERLRQASAGGGPVASEDNSPWRIAPILVWCLVLAALARPQWLGEPIVKNQPTRDLLLLVDLSGSMNTEDFANAAGDKVTRLAAVKEVLGDFLQRREGDRVGLVVFGDAAFLQAPFSTDLSLSRRLLDETAIGMAGPRTAFGDAIGLGITLFDHSEAPARTIIALTDGNDTASKVPPVEAARVARQRDIRLHTVAIGDPTSAGEEKLDEAVLRETADAAGGSYFFAADRAALEGIYDELDRIETRQIQVMSHRPRRDLYFGPLLAALAVSMLDKSRFLLRRSHADRGEGEARIGVRVDPITGELKAAP